MLNDNKHAETRLERAENVLFGQDRPFLLIAGVVGSGGHENDELCGAVGLENRTG